MVTFVFHNQDNNIDQQVAKLEESIKISGFDVEYIHTGPVIRREEVFGRYSIDERRKLLYKMLNFVNGQHELSVILNAVFSIQFASVEFRKVAPQRYRLLQAADFICSMELLKIKRDERRLSRSEEKFFYKPQELKKVFLKNIEKKKL